MRTKKVNQVLAIPFFILFVLILQQNAMCQYTEQEFKQDVYDTFINLETDLMKMNDQIVFMSENNIYDVNKINQLQKSMKIQKQSVKEVTNQIKKNGLMGDPDYRELVNVYTDELNNVIGNLNIYTQQFLDYDKSERGKQLIDALNEIFNGK